MKKLFAILAAASLAASMVSCGAAASESTASVNDQGLLSDGKLMMATNAEFPPYEMASDGDGVNGTGLEGIDVEIASAIASDLGLELEVYDLSFDETLTSIQNGKADMVLAGLSYSEDRDEVMDFTDAYTQSVQVIIVKDDSAIASAEDLANADLIGTQIDTTAYTHCSEDFGDTHVATYDDGAAAVQALIDGQVDCVVIDQAPAEEYVAANEELSILDSVYLTEDYCIAVSEGNTVLQETLNEELKKLNEEGKIQEIIDSYIHAN